MKTIEVNGMTIDTAWAMRLLLEANCAAEMLSAICEHCGIAIHVQDGALTAEKVVSPVDTTQVAVAPPNVPPRCPKCKEFEYSRECRPNGNSTCVNGHTYPSKDAL